MGNLTVREIAESVYQSPLRDDNRIIIYGIDPKGNEVPIRVNQILDDTTGQFDLTLKQWMQEGSVTIPIINGSGIVSQEQLTRGGLGGISFYVSSVLGGLPHGFLLDNYEAYRPFEYVLSKEKESDHVVWITPSPRKWVVPTYLDMEDMTTTKGRIEGQKVVGPPVPAGIFMSAVLNPTNEEAKKANMLSLKRFVQSQISLAGSTTITTIGPEGELQTHCFSRNQLKFLVSLFSRNGIKNMKFDQIQQILKQVPALDEFDQITLIEISERTLSGDNLNSTDYQWLLAQGIISDDHIHALSAPERLKQEIDELDRQISQLDSKIKSLLGNGENLSSEDIESLKKLQTEKKRLSSPQQKNDAAKQQQQAQSEVCKCVAVAVFKTLG